MPTLESVGTRPELVSKQTRRAIRDLASGSLVLREIHGAWEDEGFAPSTVENREYGERRSAFRQYEDAVDWTDPAQVARALRVFEVTLDATAQELVAPVERALRKDGWQRDGNGHIRRSHRDLTSSESLASLSDSSAIIDAFDRISRTLPEHPRDAIGAAKELVESTAKLILHERGEAVNDRLKFPALVARSQESLGVRSSQIGDGPDSKQATKRVLGGLESIVIGLDELRNLGYGTGHGPATTPVGLHARHAHLAVSAARTWVTFMLDTFTDPNAPWKQFDAVGE